ncbi:hypothetical protein CEN44_09265 [Fischerella muscicola CCMEE 5323]|uniref:Uncharacterized protein n=1 Tax=Fischerella muscicola CCMEE 5323 TaxID=2019572 RepID=A0A2N6K4P4_FISMU|nr:hypothetical protein CEN44_09265 [Fischerella muscicola CCMEE 5323]
MHTDQKEPGASYTLQNFAFCLDSNLTPATPPLFLARRGGGGEIFHGKAREIFSSGLPSAFNM